MLSVSALYNKKNQQNEQDGARHTNPGSQFNTKSIPTKIVSLFRGGSAAAWSHARELLPKQLVFGIEK